MFTSAAFRWQLSNSERMRAESSSERRCLKESILLSYPKCFTAAVRGSEARALSFAVKHSFASSEDEMTRTGRNPS
ncbi:hypothetical protein SUGI_0546190 [Cryptomeria japonica]|nr:hypothetical protein SUGI_0546190 [Cryptomeria japonica]